MLFESSFLFGTYTPPRVLLKNIWRAFTPVARSTWALLNVNYPDGTPVTSRQALRARLLTKTNAQTAQHCYNTASLRRLQGFFRRIAPFFKYIFQ
jgi:hypothetical protein